MNGSSPEPIVPHGAGDGALGGAVDRAIEAAADRVVHGGVDNGTDGAVRMPLPVPETHVVTDEDRNRYGLLLDHAAERGLLDPYEYEVRLKDLAAASTIDQMNRIVTELPAFASSSAPATRGSLAVRVPELPLSAGTGRRGARRRASPWLLLAVVVVVVAASLVFLSLLAAHVAHTHHSGLAPLATARPLSALHL